MKLSESSCRLGSDLRDATKGADEEPVREFGVRGTHLDGLEQDEGEHEQEAGGGSLTEPFIFSRREHIWERFVWERIGAGYMVGGITVHRGSMCQSRQTVHSKDALHCKYVVSL